MIFLDSCLVIYLVEQHPTWTGPVVAGLERAGDTLFAISPLVKCECLGGPLKRGDPILQQAYLDVFELFVLLDMPEPVYLQAARHRAQFGLKTPDALHLACAQQHGCDALWTNDDRLVIASQGMAHRVPA